MEVLRRGGVVRGPLEKKGPEIIRALVIGGPKEDRTPDLRIANAALSQLSYRPGEAAQYSRSEARIQTPMAPHHGGLSGSGPHGPEGMP